MTATEDLQTGQSTVHLPRIAIKFCTQCKWNLRAAYYAQELLQTFSTTIGEIALVPVTGGIFTVTLHHYDKSSTSSADPDLSRDTSNPSPTPTSSASSSEPTPTIKETLLWDRKQEGGFPETKELKNRVRNILEPKRDLGHIDRSLKKAGATTATTTTSSTTITATTAGKEEESDEKNKSKEESYSSSSSSRNIPERVTATTQMDDGNSITTQADVMSKDKNKNDGDVSGTGAGASAGTTAGIQGAEDAQIKECEDCK